MTLVEKLRTKKSRDNRELLDRAADRIEELELLLNQNKSNNFDVKSNNEIEEMVMELAEAHHEMDVAWTNYFSDSEKFPKPKTEHLILAEHLYNAGYRKQSEKYLIKESGDIVPLSKQSEGERVERVNPFIEDTIYPLTIIADRYSGTYSGGRILAWNLEADAIPEGAQGYDGDDALDFWENDKTPCGKGRTVSEAVLDLYVKMKGGEG